MLSATKLATARTINGVAFDGTANIIVRDSTAVTLIGNQTIAGVKTFSSGIVGNITGNADTATKLSTTRANYKGTTDSVVVGEMMWKNYGDNHTIFDASASISPTGVAVNNTNPNVPWGPTYPTLMGYNAGKSFGVRVDSSKYADRLSGDRIITLGGDLTGSVNFDGSSNVTLSAQVNDNSHNHTQLYGTISCSSSTGNQYNSTNIMVNGNGPANTIKPGIGFHQPSLYAGTLLQLNENTFQFQNQSGQPATLANPTSTDLPRGFIGMWSGSIATIPSGWALCNGANGTPDLRDRFVVGAGSTYGVGATGGSKDAIVVSHTHTQAAHSHTASTDSTGAHTHGVTAAYNNEQLGLTAGGLGANNASLSTTSAGAHAHTVYIGGATPAINYTGSSGSNANLPPYYALAYIMKL